MCQMELSIALAVSYRNCEGLLSFAVPKRSKLRKKGQQDGDFHPGGTELLFILERTKQQSKTLPNVGRQQWPTAKIRRSA